MRIQNTGTFTSSRIKNDKEFTKQQKSRFFLLLLLDETDTYLGLVDPGADTGSPKTIIPDP
jgi:hypothetical protein